ncbi:DUF6502 family protein [Roseovarius sp. EL26]|uniref:DUF6502 family protein n=1 Tax=Roseovarius sp. EL26 TaxID=2126672 RepID=UPI000EA30455|nr:DUF6502 family protein [Roseovarius sp. EL26]
MEEIDKTPSEQMLLALLQPMARLMINNGIGLAGAVELLKSALVAEAYAQAPEVSVSHVSLMTGVHRKDIKRLERGNQPPSKASAAARVLTLWQNEPGYLEDGQPRKLSRQGDAGFDALVGLAKVDAAPATLLSVLLASGNVTEEDGLICFVTASMVPHDRDEKMRAAVATVVPHLDTTVGNLTGETQHWDQALRYSHLSKEAADELEKDATRMALDMLQALNKKANALQHEENGMTLFVAGTYVNKKVQDL